jgi:pentatricopeptide repeat protein
MRTYSAFAIYIYVQRAWYKSCKKKTSLQALKLARQGPPDSHFEKKSPRKQMRTDVSSPKFLLNELHKSNRPGAIEEAETIFNAIAMPDTVTYTLLMNMYGRRRLSGKALSLFDRMQSEFKSGKNVDCCPNMRTYDSILYALQHSNRPDVIEKAKQIFSAIQSPDTFIYTNLINIYGRKRDLEMALSLYYRMQSDFKCGINKNCEPGICTHIALLNALKKSTRPDSVEKAEQIFSAIQSPDTVAYNTLIYIYAERKDFEKSLNLFFRMQSEYKSGKNTYCEPNNHTYTTILKALLKSTPPDVIEKAEQIFSAIQLPNTYTYTSLMNL